MSMPHSIHLHTLPLTPIPAFALSERRNYPRVFLLVYDTTKVKIQYHIATALQGSYEAWGTLYPNGTVTLETGVQFQTMFELRTHFAEVGKYTLYWLEEGNELREETQDA